MSSGWFTTSRARPAYTVAQLGALRDTSSAEIPHGASSKMAPSHKPSRHLACNLCRDRKVKCDGAKPECEKCVKAGETCSYSTTSKASRAELQQTILQLHERIGIFAHSFVFHLFYRRLTGGIRTNGSKSGSIDCPTTDLHVLRQSESLEHGQPSSGFSNHVRTPSTTRRPRTHSPRPT